MNNEGQVNENTSLKEGQLVSQGNYVLKRLQRDDVTGQVWLATRTDLLAEVRELRFLPHELVKNPQERPRLRSQINKISELNHPSLAKIYGYIREEDEDIICQEYFDAPSLTDLSFERQGRVFPEDWLKYWLPQVLDALEYAQNTSGLAHGHLKPQFILLNAEGQAKVLEFHVARMLRDVLQPAGQQGGHAGATLAHASPERIAGRDLGLAEDVYSMGAILYELMAGEAPFASDAGATVPRPLAEVRKANSPKAAPISEKLSHAISACLDADPDKRPSSLAALRDLVQIQPPSALKAAAKPEASIPQPQPATLTREEPVTLAHVFPTVEASPKRRSPLPVLVIIVVAGLIFGVWKSTSGHREPKKEAALAENTVPAPGTVSAPKEFAPAAKAPATVAVAPRPAESKPTPTPPPAVAVLAPTSAPTVQGKAPDDLPAPQLPPALAKPAEPIGAPGNPAEVKLAQARQEEIRKLLSSANEALQGGNFEESLVSYSTVASLTREYVGDNPTANSPAATTEELDPQFLKSMKDSAAYAWHGRGECHFEQGKYDEALKEFQTAAAINKQNDQTLARIGQVFLELRDFPKAKQAIDKALELNPKQANAILALGRWQVVQSQDYEAALKTLDSALALRPELAEAYYWKGKSYGGLKNYDAEKENLGRSEAGFTQIIQHRKLAGRWLAFRGSSRLWQSKFQGAAEDFSEVVRMLPNYGFAYSNRGYAYLRLGQTQKAIQDFDQAARLEPDLPANFINRGDAFLRLGQAEKAAEDYTKALALDARNPVAWHNRAMANLRLNRYQSAVGDFDKAIELDPKATVVYLSKANAQYAADDFPAAIRTFAKVIELDPKNAQAYRDRGVAQFATGLYTEAIADLTKSIELNDKDYLVYFRRGAALDANGQYKEAVADYTRSIELNGKDPRVFKARADSYSTLSEIDKANEDFRKGEELEKEANADSQASAPL